MNSVRLKTSEVGKEKLDEIHSTLRLSSKAAIARIALSFSLLIREDPRKDFGKDKYDSNGFEFQRSTLTGDYDDVYKVMITEHLGKSISEEEYFPFLFKAHLERGLKLLYAEYQMAGNRQKLIQFLLGSD